MSAVRLVPEGHYEGVWMGPRWSFVRGILVHEDHHAGRPRFAMWEWLAL